MFEALIQKKAKLAVVGLGYVGLPLALAFAKRFSVIGYDINEKGCQISYYDDSMEEPDTMMASSKYYLITLLFA